MDGDNLLIGVRLLSGVNSSHGFVKIVITTGKQPYQIVSDIPLAAHSVLGNILSLVKQIWNLNFLQLHLNGITRTTEI